MFQSLFDFRRSAAKVATSGKVLRHERRVHWSTKDQSLKSKRKLRKEDRKQWKEDRRNKRAEEKKVRDYHKRIQTKEVRHRMKRSKKTAARNRDHTREPFFQRMFHKKGKGKRVKQPTEKTSKVKQY